MASKRNTKGGSMATKRNNTEAVEMGKLTTVPLHSIDFESFQNVRSAGWQTQTSTETGDGSSFADLRASIFLVGQKDPITIRPKAKVGKDGFEYECVKGFQRGTARLMNAAGKDIVLSNGVTHKPPVETEPTIKVIIKDLTDLQALEECTYENTARNNLTPADTAAAAVRLLNAFEADGVKMTVNQLAQRMGKNQSWLNSLVNLARKGGKVFDSWQTERQVSVPAAVMTKLLNQCTTGEGDSAIVDLDKAESLYKEVKKNNGKLPSARNPDTFKQAKAAATEAGRMLGRLEASGHITLAPELQAATTRELLVSCGVSLAGLDKEQTDTLCNTLTAARIQSIAATKEAATKAGVSAKPAAEQPKRRSSKAGKEAAAN